MKTHAVAVLATGLLFGSLAAGSRGGSLQAEVPADDLPATLPRTGPFGLPAWSAPETEDRLAALGRRLFFDPRLSVDGSVACASCHDPAKGFADDVPFSIGVKGKRTTRNAPSLFNRAYGTSFMWDGRFPTLEVQVLQPIVNELEMDLPLDELVTRLRADASYVEAFELALQAPPSRGGLGLALAAFVRRIFHGSSPLDRFRAGDRDALTVEERAGMWLYESRGGCWRCHSGPTFTDEDFHNTGVGSVAGVPEEGRYAVTGHEADRGAFKTPTLRGLTLTAPYMHDGSITTLAEVVEFYRDGGKPNANLDARMTPLELTDEEAANLVAFLEALSRRVEPFEGLLAR